MSEEQLIHVIDENKSSLGLKDLTIVHKENLLHRAIHILVINSKCEIFIRKRSLGKKLYPGVWSTSVGAHILNDETDDQAAQDNLKSFLNLNLFLEKIGEVRVQDNTENEIITVYVCQSDFIGEINSQQIAEGQFMTVSNIENLISLGQTTPHLKASLELYKNSYR